MNDGRAIALLKIAKVIKMLSNATESHCKLPGPYILADYCWLISMEWFIFARHKPTDVL